MCDSSDWAADGRFAIEQGIARTRSRRHGKTVRRRRSGGKKSESSLLIPCFQGIRFPIGTDRKPDVRLPPLVMSDAWKTDRTTDEARLASHGVEVVPWTKLVV
jgi:hypothetical protein